MEPSLNGNAADRLSALSGGVGLEADRTQVMARGQANVGVEGSSETAKKGHGGLGPFSWPGWRRGVTFKILNGLMPSRAPDRPPDRGCVPGYSVVRRRNSQAAKGAATARMNADHATPASTGCCIGHASIVADGLGFPQS